MSWSGLIHESIETNENWAGVLTFVIIANQASVTIFLPIQFFAMTGQWSRWFFCALSVLIGCRYPILSLVGEILTLSVWSSKIGHFIAYPFMTSVSRNDAIGRDFTLQSVRAGSEAVSVMGCRWWFK